MKLQKKKKGNWSLHLMMLPSVTALVIFSYVPMAGIIIAFQKFNPGFGLFGESPWVGLDNFRYIFSLPSIWQVVGNTLILSVAKIIIGTILAIATALLLNECRLSLIHI